MKALTVYQPWASLIALGVKTIETRSWKTNYTGPLAIHAANKGWPCTAISLMKERRVIDAYHEAKNISSMLGWKELWVRGAIVATCRLAFCREILEWPDLYVYDARLKAAVRIEESLEGMLGDYTPGRYAWVLEDIRPLQEPIDVKGHQRLWEWNEQEARV